ncbi:MAG TPA: sugar ABC transporter substrate-binding protein [Candidatus Hungatella pullicola]|nr:sugar ABC transporter substrate-binding protein [Candidatus Hungatella pullicola]
MKRVLPVVCSMAMLASMMSGCSASADNQGTAAAEAGESTVETKAEDSSGGEVTTIRFYGSDADYNRNIIAGFEAENPDIKVEIVPVDFDNAEQVIKTGIASGDPVDVSFFWGSQISAFVDDDMALDLTPYLTENDNEWLNTFVPAYIDSCKIGDSYYAVAYQPVIETIFYNKDLFAQYNVEEPKTWEELAAACEVFKENGVYGIGNWNGQNHQLLQFAYQYMANDGTLEEYTSGEGDFTQCQGLKTCLENWKSVYDNGYWYPGEGALTSTKEQTQAAWYQGNIAMLFDAGSNAGEYVENSDFEVGILPFPYVEEGGKYALNTVTNALFIPANAKHPEEAVRFMKYYTSDAGIQEIINSGRLPSTISMQDKVDSQILKDLLATTVGDNVVGYVQMQGLSSEINAYLQNDLIGAVCSGTSVEDALQQLEDLRLSTVN